MCPKHQCLLVLQKLGRQFFRPSHIEKQLCRIVLSWLSLGVAYWVDVIPETIIFSVHHNGMGVHDSLESLFGIDLDLLQLGKLHLQIGNLINAETFCGFNDLFFIHINLMLQAWIQLPI